LMALTRLNRDLALDHLLEPLRVASTDYTFLLVRLTIGQTKGRVLQA
jgi:hypothetical protein